LKEITYALGHQFSTKGFNIFGTGFKWSSSPAPCDWILWIA
jgi:hypothetical protein